MHTVVAIWFVESALIAAITSGMAAPASAAQDVSATFSSIKPSIAIIENSEGSGTGFCIASTGTASYYLTNAHVVGKDASVTVIRQYPAQQTLVGTVVAKGLEQDPDLAVVRVPIGNVHPLSLRLAVPQEGSQVANAGYPSAQYLLARISGDLVPAVHVGTVSAVVNRGRVIEYDAQTLPGNSGGPLFDPTNGDVVGVIRAKIKNSTDANLAIGIGAIVAPFLKQNDLAFSVAIDSLSPVGSTTSTQGLVNESNGALRTLPGAGKVAIVYDSSHATGNGPAMVSAAASEFAQKFEQRFGIATIVVPATLTGAADVAEAAKSHDALIGVTFAPGFQFTSSYANQYGQENKIILTLGSSMIDPYGDVWFGDKKEKRVTSRRDPYSAVTSSLADLSDQVIETMSDEMLKVSPNPDSARINFFRYALPIADGEKRAFFGVVPAPNGGRVTSCSGFGVASKAGLQIGDIVTSVNGTSLAGLTQESLTQLLRAAAASGSEHLEVVGADGKPEKIEFNTQDLRYYVQQRASTRF